jgi:hypothetical protein
MVRPLRTGLTDLRLLLGNGIRAQGRSATFNAARTAELVWRRFGIGQRFDPTSELRLDVVIPAAEGDSEVLPLAVAGLRRNLTHPFGRIIVVAAVGGKVQRVATQLGCEVVDEDTVLPVSAADIDYRLGDTDRSGWLFAQLIKLSPDLVSSEQKILILDADTVMIRPQTLSHRGRVVALVSSEYHPPYFSAYEAVLGHRPASRLSFIAHHTVMDRQILCALRDRIEEHSGRVWWQAIIDACDVSCLSCFADYELYGNFALSCDRSLVRRWWANLPLARGAMAPLDDLQRTFGSTYRTVSFHHYL